jgi:hypothetical protein
MSASDVTLHLPVIQTEVGGVPGAPVVVAGDPMLPIAVTAAGDGIHPIAVTAAGDGIHPIALTAAGDGIHPIAVTAAGDGIHPIAVTAAVTAAGDGINPIAVTAAGDGRNPIAVTAAGDGRNPIALTADIKLEPLDIKLEPVKIDLGLDNINVCLSLAVTEFPRMQVHLPSKYDFGFSLFGLPVVNFSICGESSLITEDNPPRVFRTVQPDPQPRGAPDAAPGVSTDTPFRVVLS